MTRHTAMIAVLVAVGCGGGEPVEETVIRPVRTAVIEAAGGERTRALAGTVQAGTQSRLSFKVAGTVAELPVSVGDRVQPGQLIARLNATDYELQLAEAQAGLVQARAQARSTAAQYERTRELYVNNDASKAQLDSSRAADESAQASVASIYKRLELAKAQVEYTRLEAAVEGAVADVLVTESENVSAGSPIVVLTSGEQPEIQVAVPESLISALREGDHATATVDALGEEVIDVTITEVGVAATSTVTAFPVTVRIDEEGRDGASQRDAIDRIRPGMAAEVSLVFVSDSPREHVLAPPVAIGEDRDGRFAFVVEAGTEAGLYTTRRREVKTGEIVAEGLEVLDGLQAGDVVVTAGVTRVTDGMTVRLLAGAQAPGGAAP